MRSEVIDRDGRAAAFAAEGSVALGRGLTAVAADKYAAAGQVLLLSARTYRRASTRATATFLAASQFYHGGAYQTARRITARVEQRLLPPQYRVVFERFKKDARDRASIEYPQQVQSTLANLWDREDYARMLEVLKTHPYVYRQDYLALGRGVLCDRLGKWSAAAYFYGIAIRELPDRHETISIALARAMSLPQDVSVDVALKFVSKLSEYSPDPVITAALSLLWFNRGQEVQGEERRAAHFEQLRLFENFRQAGLSTIHSGADEYVVSIVGLCYESAIRAMMRLGRTEEAKALSEEAVRLDPASPGPLIARGILSYPSERSNSDLRAATTLPNCGWAAYYYLAHDAFLRQDFARAEELVRRALSIRSGSAMRAQMLAWLAVFRDCRQAPIEEVEALFQSAFQLDPEDDRIGGLYRIYKDSLAPVGERRRGRWDAQLRVDILRDNEPSRIVSHSREDGGHLSQAHWKTAGDRTEGTAPANARDPMPATVVAVPVAH